MMIRFLILLTIDIKHAYYQEHCRDFDFLLPADTAQLLKNGKSIAKVRDKLYLLYETDEAGAALAEIAGKTARIGLKLVNPHFGNLTEGGSPPSFAVYRNATDPDRLDPVERAILTGPRFSHLLTDPARPVTVSLTDRHGEILQAEIVAAANNRSDLSYDLTGWESGAYLVQEVRAGGSASTRYYIDPELHQQGAFGVVETAIDGSFYTDPPDFEIPFGAKEETLKYYVVAKNYSNTDINQLSISDAGFAEEGRPQLNFTKVASAAFTVDEIPSTLLGGDNAKVVLFKSQTAVPRREKPRKKIQLKKNNDVLIPHLPQPAAGKANSDLIIQISKP